ncbi:MAG: hypothetical protein A3F90_03055 [Deltaproteobacteria bacterium RIFCSPLOWO2_12_FULL_60_19]|nr:MAG: hypothetical protein A3F90_03055 [Deltaproteobacteria bacterium RIFCSPLOWO2_12_FULL_60_19]
MTPTTLRDAYRSISQLHENEKLAAWLQSKRAIVWLTPRRRRQILFFGALLGGTIALFRRQSQWRDHLSATSWLAPALALPILLALVYLLYLAAIHFSRLPAAVRRRPQIALHLVFWLIIALAWITPEEAGVWKTAIFLIAVSIPYLIWRCGYMLLSGQRGKAAGTAFRDHLFYIWPMWGGTNTPQGKGADYLTQCEAQSPAAYARSVLAGIKLLILARIWDLTKLLMGVLVFSNPKSPLAPSLGGYSLEIPRARTLLTNEIPASLLMTWLSLYLEFIWETLDIAEDSHFWIGLLRLFGFNVFRNTYKPLLAKSIVDFWNRYYYYFKELLVEFFFFPTYVRYFRAWPKLRMFAAVFAAAFLGNIYYHSLRASGIAAGELPKIWVSLGRPRAGYCFLLAVGIYISMLRQQKKRGTGAQSQAGAALPRRLIQIAGVWTFFSVIHIWNLKSPATLFDRVGFFLSLFGF